MEPEILIGKIGGKLELIAIGVYFSPTDFEVYSANY
jgi:hypothetical protein